MPDPRFTEDVDASTQDKAIAEVLERAIESGRDAVKRGPELLPALKDAGVVDAGGHAATILFAGIVASLRGAEPPELETYAPARVTHPQHSSSTYRYCTNFAVTGSDLDAPAFTDALEGIGDSVLVVGDSVTLKVHVHTDNPEAATAVFATHGEVSHLDVADMHEQIAAREAHLAETAPAQCCGVLAVVSGAGMHSLYAGLGAHPLEGGPTMNPSTYDVLAGIHAVPAEELVVLPNSPNVIMAAERAAELSEKHVLVVPSTSPQAGLAAALVLDPTRGAESNAQAMQDAIAAVRTGAVAQAARDDAQGRFRAGEAVGFIGDELVAWGEPAQALRAVIESLSDGAELVTCIAGKEAPLGAEDVAGLAPSGIELELEHGGQPSYWWLLSAE